MRKNTKRSDSLFCKKILSPTFGIFFLNEARYLKFFFVQLVINSFGFDDHCWVTPPPKRTGCEKNQKICKQAPQIHQIWASCMSTHVCRLWPIFALPILKDSWTGNSSSIKICWLAFKWRPEERGLFLGRFGKLGRGQQFWLSSAKKHRIHYQMQLY